jgi:hypothetical protein
MHSFTARRALRFCIRIILGWVQQSLFTLDTE